MSSLPPSDLLPISKDFLVDIGGWPMLKQAQGIVDAHRILSVSYHAPILSGRILVDDRELVTRLKIGRRLSDVENLCTCRQAKMDGSICAHVLAAGLEWLRLRAQGPSLVKDKESQSVGGSAIGVSGFRPSAQVAEKVSKPEPVWRCLTGAQSGPSRLLEVRVLLPLNWPQVLIGNRLRLILEGKVEGDADFRPWDSISRTGVQMFAVGEEDEALLRFIEQRHGGKIPGILELSDGDWHRFFKTVVNHPRLWIGKRSLIRVTALQRKPALLLQSGEQGGLRLTLQENAWADAGQLFPMGEGAWRWRASESILEESFALPAPYTALQQGPVTIGSAHVATFLERELPALSRLMEVKSDGSFEKIVFEKATPRIVATLEGGLPGLSLRLEAEYAGTSVLLSPKQLESEGGSGASEWKPDARNPLRYWSRDVAAERAVLREVVAAGFAAGHRSPDNFFLSGERAVGIFLANVFPRWRQQWKVSFGPRMENLVPRLEYVEPEITLRETGNDWLGLDLHLRAPTSNAVLSPAEVQRWLQTGSSHQRTAGDRVLLIPTKGWEELQQVLADCDVSQEPGQVKMGKRFAPYFAGAVEAQGWKLSARSNWSPDGGNGVDQLPPLRDELVTMLRPYQRQGVEWLCGLAQRKLSGLLADEMGLGKTVQMLAMLERLHSSRGDAKNENSMPQTNASESFRSPSLIICPTSLVENWRSEATRFTPGLKVLVLHGAERHEQFAEIASHDVVITSYALLRRDLDNYLEHEFTAVILDEAQHIKNRSSLNAQSAKALKATHRFVLTGTPLENSLFDLWSIFDFLMPGYLGTVNDFKDRYEVPIAREHDGKAQERLRLRLRPFFLRRTKEEVVKDLPAKLEQVAFCDLTDEQQTVYQAILDQGRREVFEGSGKSGQGKNRIAVLTALLRLRQAACHLALLPGEDVTKKEWKEPSAKFEMCMELVNEAVDGGHRVLVFSQFVQLLHLFRSELEKQELEFCYLDGSTVDRAREVARFQNTSSIPVFLISLKAGGVGLNLTGADTVLHLDPWWNPAVEDQATARAHRIGQTRVVNSYKIIARGTVEEKIMALQERKKELIAANMSNEAVFVESLSWEEVERLFE